MNMQELSDAKTVKQELNRKHGLPPRFRQRLFHCGSPVHDSARLDSIPFGLVLKLQLVLLPYSATSETQAEELATAAANGLVSEASV